MTMGPLTPEEMMRVVQSPDREATMLKARIKEMEEAGSPYVIGAKAILAAHEAEIELLACIDTMNSIIATSTPPLIAAASDLPRFIQLLGTIIKTFFILGRLYQMNKYKENE